MAPRSVNEPNGRELPPTNVVQLFQAAPEDDRRARLWDAVFDNIEETGRKERTAVRVADLKFWFKVLFSIDLTAAERATERRRLVRGIERLQAAMDCAAEEDRA
ncbi:MAG: hypothetical protein ACREP2_04825 [Rhodanobacteraceae bacterium]